MGLTGSPLALILVSQLRALSAGNLLLKHFRWYNAFITFLPVEMCCVADPCLAADLRKGRAFLTLLHAERFLSACKLRRFHAKPPRAAGDNYGNKL